jgi:hypothetical protein
MVLVAQLGDEIVAIARYDRCGDGEAEVAFTVDDEQQGRDLATLLLEHLAVVARGNGIHVFLADTLSDNQKMLNVFRRLPVGSASATSTREPCRFGSTSTATTAVDRRGPGAGASGGGRVDRAVDGAAIDRGDRRQPAFRDHRLRALPNLLRYGFEGPVYPVNPLSTSVAGVRAYPTVLDVPDAVDLAVIVVPAPAVPDVVRECAEKRVRGLVIISAGFAEVGATGRRRTRAGRDRSSQRHARHRSQLPRASSAPRRACG